MANRRHMKEWQNRIADVCTRRLQRSLTEEEEEFIASHVGFMALEGVEDAVKTLSLDALEELLNSKNT